MVDRKLERVASEHIRYCTPRRPRSATPRPLETPPSWLRSEATGLNVDDSALQPCALPTATLPGLRSARRRTAVPAPSRARAGWRGRRGFRGRGFAFVQAGASPSAQGRAVRPQGSAQPGSRRDEPRNQDVGVDGKAHLGYISSANSERSNGWSIGPRSTGRTSRSEGASRGCSPSQRDMASRMSWATGREVRAARVLYAS